MNNRFKFRVFLKYNQAMYDIDSFCYLEGLNKGVFHFKQGGQKTLKNDDFVLMQCTGLKDKNGKLIYEGDIVATIIKNLDGKTIINTPEVVEYDENFCMFRTHFSTLSKRIEVIGNIYEDKDLLNENS